MKLIQTRGLRYSLPQKPFEFREKWNLLFPVVMVAIGFGLVGVVLALGR